MTTLERGKSLVRLSLLILVSLGAMGCEKPTAQTGPRQTGVPEEELGEVRVGDFSLKKRARFQVDGRVVSSASYQDGPQALVSPLDLVVSWGDDGPPAGAIFQRNRWYYLRREMATPEVLETTANFHIVGGAAEKLLGLGTGTRVKLSGWLVDVEGPDGFVWKTSLSRGDRGNGACEIFFVKRLQIEETPSGS